VDSKTREIYHNNGQKDAAKGYGNYNPPNGVLHTVISEDAAEANRSYREGYQNGIEQRPK